MKDGWQSLAWRLLLSAALVVPAAPVETSAANPVDEDTVVSSFLFPVSLLNELGYFRPSLRFWTWESFPGAMELADRIESRIRAMGLSDTESAKVLRRFEEARRERRAWKVGGVLLLLVCGLVGWRMVRRFRSRVPSEDRSKAGDDPAAARS